MLSGLTWAWLRYTWVGKGLRACVEDAPIAAAFGVNHRRLALLLSGLAAAFAGVAGVFVALIYTLAPPRSTPGSASSSRPCCSGAREPLGPLVAGVVIGVSEALTMA